MANPQPQVNLPRSKGASEIHVPAITTVVASLTLSATAATVSLPSGMVEGMVVRVACSEDCYIRWSDDATAATTADTLMIRGVEPQMVPAEATSISALRVNTDGVMTVTTYA